MATATGAQGRRRGGGGARRRISAAAAAAAAAVGAVVAATIAPATDAFYLPGIAPVDYQEGYALTVYANKLTSPKDHVPFDYYSMGYCQPKSGKKPRSTHLSLGQVLVGERHEATDYELLMRVDDQCKQLCQKELTVDEVDTFVKRVDLDYLTKMNLDNMPIIMRGPTQTGEEVFQLGYPVGFPVNGSAERCLFNHLSFKVMVHKPSFSGAGIYSPPNGEEVFRVVGFEVTPESIDGGCSARVAGETPKHACVKEGQAATMNWTYGVTFQESNIEWATRWDPLLNATPGVREIQWFSIINSLMIALFLTAMVALVLLRTVYLDFARYNSMDNEEEVQEESGWKLIHGDVFRPPRAAGMLSVFVGSGTQLIAMMTVTLAFAVLGFLSPANRGGLLTALLTCWVFTSSFCGYHAAKLYTNLGGENKKAVTLGSAFFFSSVAFSVFFSLNLLLWLNGSTGAVPFLTLLLLLLLWFGISVPLNVLGAYAGYKAKAIEWPVRTNQIPREIPHSSTVPPMVFAVFCGVLPFGTVFLELVFVLNSLANNLLLYYFGFTFVVALILAVTCAEVVRWLSGGSAARPRMWLGVCIHTTLRFVVMCHVLTFLFIYALYFCFCHALSFSLLLVPTVGCYHLLDALQGGLPLVVALVCCVRLLRTVRVCIRALLPLVAAGVVRHAFLEQHAVHGLRFPRVPGLWADHGRHWLLRILPLCARVLPVRPH